MIHASAVAWAVMENHGFDQVKDLPSHKRLFDTGAVFTNYFGASHPSGPNYRALACGDTIVPTEEYGQRAPSIARMIAQQTITGKFSNYTTTVIHLQGTIAARHHPYADTLAPFKEITDPTKADWTQGFDHVYVGWDDNNNGHSANLDIADKNLSDLLDTLDASKWFNTPSVNGLYPVFMFAWDESFLPDNNHVFCAFYGKGVKRGQYNTRYDHYSFNRTMCEIYESEILGYGKHESAMLDPFV